MRNRRLSLTTEGGIVFGAFMLVVIIILIVMLLRLPSSREKDENLKKGTVWAQVLSTSDIQRLEAAEPQTSVRGGAAE